MQKQFSTRLVLYDGQV